MSHCSAPLVYLDYNSTTPLAEDVVEAILARVNVFGNPSNAHPFGQQAKEEIDAARGQAARLVGAKPEELIFTASGSESVNLAIKGLVPERSNAPLHVITSTIEHAAVLNTCRRLERLGHQVTYVPVDGQGRVDPADVAQSIKSNTRLITIMHANNETGVIQPIEQIGAIAREEGVFFHTDATQSVGKIPVSLDHLPVDLLTFSAHKLYGPKGVGALVVREGVKLQPLVHGGGQELGLRAGTENLLGIAGAGAACESAQRRLHEDGARLAKLRSRLLQGLLTIGDIRVNGELHLTVPGTLNVSFGHIKGDALAMALALKGIAVSTGSACHSTGGEPSHVLRAMDIGERWLHGPIRFSLGQGTTEDDIDYTLDVVATSVARLRHASPLARSA